MSDISKYVNTFKEEKVISEQIISQLLFRT